MVLVRFRIGQHLLKKFRHAYRHFKRKHERARSLKKPRDEVVKYRRKRYCCRQAVVSHPNGPERHRGSTAEVEIASQNDLRSLSVYSFFCSAAGQTKLEIG